MSNEWIPVDAGDLPKRGVRVRCKLPKNLTPYGCGYRDLYRMKHNGKWNDYDQYVTHWQPLPAAPSSPSTTRQVSVEQLRELEMFVDQSVVHLLTAEEFFLKEEYSEELAKELAPQSTMVRWAERLHTEIKSLIDQQ